MQQSFDPSRSVQTLALAGELDVARAPELRRVLLDVPEGVQHVVVDLTEVSFLDSTVLGVLVGANKRLRSRGSALALVGASGIPLKALRLTGLDFLLTDGAAAARLGVQA